MSETWKPVVGFEGLYEVSDLGRVRGLDRIDGQGRNWPGRILRTQYRANGYACLRLSGCSVLVHHLVLTAFCGSRPEGCEGAHQDGDQRNCRLSNLKWKTPKANGADRIRHGTSGKGAANACAKLTDDKVLAIRAATGTTRRELAVQYDVTETAIDKIIRRQRWGHV